MSAGVIKSKLSAPKTGYHSVNLFFIDRLKAWNEDTILLDCDLDRRWTGEEVYEACLNIAYHLIAEFGLRKGDIVCSIAPNSDIQAIALLAVLVAGGIYCSLSSRSTYRELSEAILDINASFVITNAANYGIAATIAAELPSYKKLLLIDEESRVQLGFDYPTVEGLIQSERSFMSLPVSGSLNEIVMITVSSGGAAADGPPKQVIRTNRNLIAMANAVHDPELANYARGDIVMGACLSHICGVALLLQSIAGGATLALSRDDLWPEEFLMNVDKYGITSAFLTPSRLYYMTKIESIEKKYHLSSLRDVLFGGHSLAESAYASFVNKFDVKYFRAAYYTTDIGWALQVFKSESKELKDCNTVGRPIGGVEIKIMDITGQPLTANSVGEICVRGDQVSPGYFNKSDENKKLLTADGFMRTGDVGYYDREGLFYVKWRSDDVIEIKGKVVSPSELESVIVSHDAVLDASVIGVDDTVHGKVPKAYVLLCPGGRLDDKSLHEFVNERVDGLKRLRGGIEFVDHFERTAIGNIRKSELRKISKF